jgi:transposase
MAAEGASAAETMRKLGTSVVTTYKWRNRFAAEGPNGLVSRSGSPDGLEIRDRNERDRVSELLDAPPPRGKGSRGWTVSAISQALKIPKGRVAGILSRKGMNPKRQHLRRATAAAAARPREELETLARWADTSAPDSTTATRARAVLAVLGGLSAKAAAAAMKASARSVANWVRNFAENGPEGLEICRSAWGSPEQLDAARRLAELLSSGRQPYARARWFATTIAKELGISTDLVRRALKGWEISLLKGPAAETPSGTGVPGTEAPETSPVDDSGPESGPEQDVAIPREDPESGPI